VSAPPWLTPRRLEALAAVLAYTAFTLFVTWPLATHLGSAAYLFPANVGGPGDLGGSIAHLRELVENNQLPFLAGQEQDFNAPDGLPVRWALNLASFPSVLVLYVLGVMFGATAAFGLFAMIGYVASGMAMFLLARRLTGSAWIAFIAGWAFAFHPFVLVTGEHPNFIHGWVLVVMLWRFLELIEEPTVRNGVWVGAASILCMSWTQYFVLIGGVAFWVLVLTALAIGLARGLLRAYAVSLAPAIGLAAGFVLVMRTLLLSTGEDETLPGNTLLDIVQTSARLPMYLVPPAHSLFGDWTVDYLGRHGWNAVEWTLYVGVSVLALALVALIAALTRRLDARRARAVVVGAILVASAFVMSLPPVWDVGGRSLRLPSSILFEASSSWRLYSRFALVVMLGLCLLAALGLHALTSRLGRRAAVALLIVATVAVPLDLWNRFPNRVYEFDTPRIYETLRAAPPGTLAEYPLRPVEAVGDYLDLVDQEAHGKPIVNGYFQGPDERRALSIGALDDPLTPGALATLGVRYVLLVPHREGPGVPPPGRPGKGFRRLAADSYGTLYRVTAAPTPFVWMRDGFWGPEGAGVNRSQWAGAGPVRLGIEGRCAPCRGELVFTAASLARSRVLRVRTQDGRVVGGTIVKTTPTVVRVPLVFDRRTVVELEIEPGPQVINETIRGSTDFRNVSVSISRARFVPR
jgi:hypothetical protein